MFSATSCFLRCCVLKLKLNMLLPRSKNMYYTIYAYAPCTQLDNGCMQWVQSYEDCAQTSDRHTTAITLAALTQLQKPSSKDPSR